MRGSDETIPQHLRRCVERLREIASENMERYELNSLASDMEDSLNDLEDEDQALRRRVEASPQERDFLLRGYADTVRGLAERYDARPSAPNVGGGLQGEITPL